MCCKAKVHPLTHTHAPQLTIAEQRDRNRSAQPVSGLGTYYPALDRREPLHDHVKLYDQHESAYGLHMVPVTPCYLAIDSDQVSGGVKLLVAHFSKFPCEYGITNSARLISPAEVRFVVWGSTNFHRWLACLSARKVRMRRSRSSELRVYGSTIGAIIITK